MIKVRNLFKDTERQQKPKLGVLEEPEITPSKVKRAISLAKNGKASGPDEVPVDLFKILDDSCINILTDIFESPSSKTC